MAEGRGLPLPLQLKVEKGFGWHDVWLWGRQNRPLQNIPLWYVDNFKPKSISVQQTQEELFTSPYSAWKNLEKRPLPGRELLLKTTFYTQRTYLHGMGTFVYQTSVLSFRWIVCHPSRPLLLSSGWNISVNYLTASNEDPKHTNFVFFLLICLMST